MVASVSAKKGNAENKNYKKNCRGKRIEKKRYSGSSEEKSCGNHANSKEKEKMGYGKKSCFGRKYRGTFSDVHIATIYDGEFYAGSGKKKKRCGRFLYEKI